MGQSLQNIYLHLVFGTKNSERCLLDEHRFRLYAYLAEVSNDIGYTTIEFGGYLDHVHGLVRMGKDVLPKDWVRTLKANSNRFLKKECGFPGGFAWQGGYAIFSVGPSGVDACRKYIKGQVEHHRVTTWHEEVERFLTQYGVAYSKNYIWTD